ncbi:MAG: PCRF domain-containing protein, partial [Candidatus Wildermuthbacteria bacterium]|nr:PCRF domain-containing protein [Candidatus Wildermuthbacteria bacterium]
MEDLEALRREYDSLEEQLTSPELISQWEKFQDLLKRKNILEKILKRSKDLEDIRAQLEESRDLLNDQEDGELSALAQAEFAELKRKEEAILKELQKGAKETEEQPGAAILEIRAGTGGGEAALFARNLLDMYAAYAQKKGWRQTVL